MNPLALPKIVLITGGFDPLHSGHIAYIKEARMLGDYLIVGVNSNEWLTRKKGRPFLPAFERVNILMNIKGVNEVICFDDSDGSAKDAIAEVRRRYPQNHIVFANGGDRTATNIPEMQILDRNVSFRFGVGGDFKKNSSSTVLSDWKNDKTERTWGFWECFKEGKTNTFNKYKIKLLTVNPSGMLSMQKHFLRTEFWYVITGSGYVYTYGEGIRGKRVPLYPGATVDILTGQWHQLVNNTTEPLVVLEVQEGIRCAENDIERFNNEMSR